jgi:hypothetical protein
MESNHSPFELRFYGPPAGPTRFQTPETTKPASSVLGRVICVLYCRMYRPSSYPPPADSRACGRWDSRGKGYPSAQWSRPLRPVAVALSLPSMSATFASRSHLAHRAWCRQELFLSRVDSVWDPALEWASTERALPHAAPVQQRARPRVILAVMGPAQAPAASAERAAKAAGARAQGPCAAMWQWASGRRRRQWKGQAPAGPAPRAPAVCTRRRPPWGPGAVPRARWDAGRRRCAGSPH